MSLDTHKLGVLHTAGLTVALLGLTGCPPTLPAEPPPSDKLPTASQAFDEQVTCNAVRPQTEPDLMAWDPGSRANLHVLRKSGVVAVRYQSEGCNVELELLSNCIAAGDYGYEPYSLSQSKVARTANELFAELPLGAASLAGKLKGGRALRTDYMLVGVASLPPTSTFRREDLQGTGCERATHVVSRIFLGGFAMVAGSTSEIEASASIFAASAGGGHSEKLETMFREGDPAQCEAALKNPEPQSLCSVPLRIGLLPLDTTGETPTATGEPGGAPGEPGGAPGEPGGAPGEPGPLAAPGGSTEPDNGTPAEPASPPTAVAMNQPAPGGPTTPAGEPAGTPTTPAAPPAAGADTATATEERLPWLYITGPVVLGVAWMTTIVVTAVTSSDDTNGGSMIGMSIIPVAGPWVLLGSGLTTDDFTGALVASGVIQALGAAATVAGIVVKVPVASDTAAASSLSVMPTGGPAGAGLRGVFEF